MSTVLAIYDALLQAGVPDAPARRVAEALEQDMTTLLATKQDLLLLRQDISHLEQLTSVKVDALGERMAALQQNTDLRLQALESRVVIKLSLVMTALIAAAGTVMAVVR
jgi:hypothetical protein